MPSLFPAARPTTLNGRCATALLGTALLIASGAAAAEREPYRGIVVKADATTQSVVVKNAQTGGRIRFAITPNTLISEANQMKTAADLVAGAQVSVEYVQVEEKYEAQRIVIVSGGRNPIKE